MLVITYATYVVTVYVIVTVKLFIVINEVHCLRYFTVFMNFDLHCFSPILLASSIIIIIILAE